MTHALESTLEPSLEMEKDIPRNAMFFCLQQIHRQRRYQRAGENIGSKHRKDYSLSKRCKQKARHPTQEEHRKEDDTNAECRDKGWYCNLSRTLENRLTQAVA